MEGGISKAGSTAVPRAQGLLQCPVNSFPCLCPGSDQHSTVAKTMGSVFGGTKLTNKAV